MKSNTVIASQSHELMDQARAALRAKHYSFQTEKAYTGWISQFLLYHNNKNPKDMAEAEINAFLKHLAVNRKVSASTQNQALCGIVYLYKNILNKEVGDLELIWAKKPKKLPVVLTHEEAGKVISQLSKMPWMAAMLMYGSGLRVKECLRLRVKDIDYGFKQITVYDGKGFKDRVTPLPEKMVAPLQEHLRKVKNLHVKDLKEGYGSVWLPYALDRKYPNAPREWAWQYVLPAYHISIDPRSGVLRRHHLNYSVLRQAVKTAIKNAGITKHAGCHTFRHSFATRLIQNGYDIRTVQELMGHDDVRTTMIYTHVLNLGGMGVKSPADEF